MRRAIATKSNKILGALLVAVGLLAPISTLATQRAVQAITHGQRPARLYKLVSSTDDGVCKVILRSLNKPFAVTARDALSSNLTSELFLSSELQVAWQRKPIGVDGILDYAEIDLANDSHPVSVYRWGFLYYEKRFENELFILPRPSKTWAGDRLPFEATSLLYDEAKVNLDRHPFEGLRDNIEQVLALKDESLAADHLNFNVLSVRGKIFLVLTGANESNGGLEGSPFHVFVVSYHSDNTVSFVCELHAGA